MLRQRDAEARLQGLAREGVDLVIVECAVVGRSAVGEELAGFNADGAVAMIA